MGSYVQGEENSTSSLIFTFHGVHAFPDLSKITDALVGLLFAASSGSGHRRWRNPAPPILQERSLIDQGRALWDTVIGKMESMPRATSIRSDYVVSSGTPRATIRDQTPNGSLRPRNSFVTFCPVRRGVFVCPAPPSHPSPNDLSHYFLRSSASIQHVPFSILVLSNFISSLSGMSLPAASLWFFSIEGVGLVWGEKLIRGGRGLLVVMNFS